MGQRSSTSTVIGLVQAFLERRTWKQADLARHLEMSVPAVRKRLVELQSAFRLETEEEHPHVYWSVPKDWFPGGVLFTREQLPELLRQLARLPRGKSRDKLLTTVLGHVPRTDAAHAIPTAVISADAEDHLDAIEDAATKKQVLRFRYFTASRGDEGIRHASVHRVAVDRPARFVATCHRTDTLKWFRVENVTHAGLEPQTEFRPAKKADIDAFVAASVGGYNAGGETQRLSFVVRGPDSRWVAKNLIPPMQAEPLAKGDGIRVTVDTNALRQVARYVTGLGGVARAETPALAAAVRELAQGALAAHPENDPHAHDDAPS